MAVCTKVYLNHEGAPSKHVTTDAVALAFTFAHGGTHTVNFDDLSNDIRAAAMRHGLAQKLGDSFAGDPPGEAEESFLAMLEQLRAGIWSGARTATGPRGGLIAEALQRVRSDKYPTVAVAAAEVASWDEATRAAKVKVPALAAMIATIRAERAAARAAALSETGNDDTDL